MPTMTNLAAFQPAARDKTENVMPEGKQPNVLLLLCDQMQAGRMGFVDGLSHTPNLDRLAREGVHYRNAFTCQGQCVPSRAAFQTGQYAHECGVMVNYGFYNHQNRLDKKHTTVGRAFQQAGYQTAYFGKSHLGFPLEKLGYETAWNAEEHMAVPDEVVRRLGIEHVPKSLRRDYWSIAEAVDWLQAYEPDGRPLFFTFSSNLPHPPFYFEDRFRDLFDEKTIPLPATYAEETFAGKPTYQREHVNDGVHGAGSPEAVRRMTAQYLTMIAMADEHVGRVIHAFERLGLWENTLVMFTADHGDMMGAHGMNVKGTLPYDELYRIPLLIKPPATFTPARRVIDDMVGNERFAATLLRGAGVPVPETFRHGDIWDSLTRTGRPDDERIFFEHYAAYWGIHPFYGVRTPAHKYIRYYGPDNCEEMYNLNDDPHELRNVADDPAHAKTKRELAAWADAEWKRSDGRDFDYYESDTFREGRHVPQIA